MRVYACMATSLDGKIGPANVQSFVPIGSRHDMEHLIALRDEADGILFGASTFRTWPKIHWGKDKNRRVHHFIMSRSLDLDFHADLFQDPLIPITIFRGSQKTLQPMPLPDHVEVIAVPDKPGQIATILNHIARLGVQSLLIEGGGNILHRFIDARALQELFLTLTPKVIGGFHAPALLGGKPLSAPPAIKVLKSTRVDDEVYLHLELNY